MDLPAISASDFARTSFDYLIIGGGTAGLAVAARLSENPEITVGVLEAGSATFDTLAINVPGRYGEGIGTFHDWQFETTHQPGLGNRKLPWPRGKVLGGTSALNFMTWNRPNKEDLDAWVELGNQGWGWNDLLPYYKKSEKFTGPDVTRQDRHKWYFDTNSLGTQGPLPIIYTQEYYDSHQHWHESLNNLDVPTNRSHMSGSNVGVWTNLVTVDPNTVTRAYAATAYYLPVAHRKNLHVLTNATVKKIVIESQRDECTATGARFVHDGVEFSATASREVILSAGSVKSPQLLELSGVGDPAILSAAGIPVKVENCNVGENLQEHMMTATIYEVDPAIASPDDLRNDSTLAEAADLAYRSSKQGPRTILPCSIAYLPLSHFVPKETLDNLASRSQETSLRAKIMKRRLSEAQRLGQIEYIFDIGNWSPFLTAEQGKKYATMLQILQYPFSRGSVHIPPATEQGSPTSDTPPVIDPQYYGGAGGGIDFDIQMLCAEFGFKIAATAPLSGIIRKRAWPPEFENISKDTENQELRKWLVDNTITDWHPVGTCAMGGSEGSRAGVVDERLKVYGVKGLRVVDASTIPLQISAHTQATVYAIAEKASDMILEDGRWCWNLH